MLQATGFASMSAPSSLARRARVRGLPVPFLPPKRCSALRTHLGAASSTPRDAIEAVEIWTA